MKHKTPGHENVGQGVVTCVLTREAFATRIKNLDL